MSDCHTLLCVVLDMMMEQFVKEHKTASKFCWSLMRDDVHDVLWFLAVGESKC